MWSTGSEVPNHSITLGSYSMQLIYKNNSPSGYYVYAYLRKSDLTLYYIGKGTGGRAQDTSSHHTKPPPDKSLIVILEDRLTELGAFALERRYIKWYGRKDTGSGILRNKTDGGEGASGSIQTKEHRHKNSEKQKLRPPPSDETCAKISHSLRGKKRTDDQKSKLSLIKTGMIAWTDGSNNIYSRESPGLGWVKGRLISASHNTAIVQSNSTRIITHETRLKHSLAQTGKIWWNNGTKNTKSRECPGDKWTQGKITKNSLKDKKKSEETRQRMKQAWIVRKAAKISN